MLSYSYDEPEHIKFIRQFVGWKEIGKNRGWLADSANDYVNSKKGSPYCQATVSWTLGRCYPGQYKKTGLATAFKGDKTYSIMDVLNGKVKIEDGDVLTWQKGKTIFGHAGFASEDWKEKNGRKGKSIQANTSPAGFSSEGSGLYEKPAEITIWSYSRIIRIHKIIPKIEPE